MHVMPIIARVPTANGDELPEPWVWWHGVGRVPEPQDEVVWTVPEDGTEDGPWMQRTGRLWWRRRGRDRRLDRWSHEPQSGPGWHCRVECTAAGSVEVDGLWYRPETIRGIVKVGHGDWRDPARRLARAPDGTPLPAGWKLFAGPPSPFASLAESLMWRSPAHLTQDEALTAYARAHATDMTTIVVRPRPNRAGKHPVWRGIGGHAQCLGELPSISEAIAVATGEIEADREELAWLPATVIEGWPDVTVIKAESPSWDAYREAMERL